MTQAACRAHPEAAAVATCHVCFAQLCEVCRVLDGMLPYCADCLRKERRKPLVRAAVVSCLAIVAGAGGYWAYRTYQPPYDYGSGADDIGRLELALSKEPCDLPKSAELLQRMLAAGDHRGVLNRAAIFSGKCGDQAKVRELTYVAHDRLGELDAALADLTHLIEVTPAHPYYRAWRAHIYEKQANLDAAVADLQQALVLYPGATDIPLTLAEILERQGKLCEATVPLENVVFRYEAEPFTAGVRARLASLDEKGGCTKSAGTRVTIRDRVGNSMFRTKVLLGAESANFVVDTGATYVTIARKVAERLRLNMDASPKGEILTANGKREGRFVILPSVAIEGLSTERVPAVVLDDIAPGVDGLLGQTFLSRFEMKQSRGTLELSRRTADGTMPAKSAASAP